MKERVPRTRQCNFEHSRQQPSRDLQGQLFRYGLQQRAVLLDKMLCCLRRLSRDRLGGSLSAVGAAGPRRLRLNPNAYEINPRFLHNYFIPLKGNDSVTRKSTKI